MIGSELHESGRIDRQLIGRAARQGDPGSCQYFVSADDTLIRLFAPQLRQRMQRHRHHLGEIRADLSKTIQRVQCKVERERYLQRAEMLRHDKWREELLEKMAKEEAI